MFFGGRTINLGIRYDDLLIRRFCKIGEWYFCFMGCKKGMPPTVGCKKNMETTSTLWETNMEIELTSR